MWHKSHYTHAVPGCDVTGERQSMSEGGWDFGLRCPTSLAGAEEPPAAATAAAKAAFFTPSFAKLSVNQK